jgi:diguanylate cyclase (GGDEF)-like protein
MLDLVDTQHVQQLLSSLPAALVLVDEDGKVCWVNETLLQWSATGEADWLGKGREQLPAHARGLLQEGSARLEGTPPRELACIDVPMGAHRLYYCSDVSAVTQLKQECQSLRDKVAELDPRDSLTGLLNRRAVFQNLEQQASRSRRYGNTLSVLILRLGNLGQYREQFGTDNADELLISVTHMLNDQMRWADLIGRIDDNEFLIVLPETEERVVKEIREKIHERLSKSKLPGTNGGRFTLQVEFGIAQWRKGDDVGLLMQRARQSLDGDEPEQVAV